MEKPSESREPQAKKPEQENAIALDKQTVKDLEADASAKERLKGGMATLRNCD